MPNKTNLLDTRTTNFQELVGNGRIYRVPAYQRDYSWEEEQWEDLWRDIVLLHEHPTESHYMGALVVEGASDREFSIIDGQQRLATLSILTLAIIARLERLAEQGNEPTANRERAQGLRRRFIGEKDPASLVESSKLFLNHTDDAFYQDYLVQLRRPINPRGLTGSNRALWSCFKYFEKEVNSLNDSGEKIAEFLTESLGRRLMFILITVDDELNAYTVFETLNARGMELSATDLLKNYLFSRTRVEADLTSLQRRWRTLVNTVQPQRFPDFLRYHLLCEIPRVRSERLFKLIRQKVGSAEEVFVLMEALEKRAELFVALSDPNHSYWLEHPEARPYIRELVIFRVRQMTPLLFATWEKFQAADFYRVLKMTAALSFRYSVIGGLNTNALEPIYHETAKAVLDGATTTPARLFEQLSPIWVSDENFQHAFANFEVNTHGQRKRLAKYILSKIEADMAGRSCDPETDPGTIEHVLPENPNAAWGDFPERYWESSIYRLGNLTLLEAQANRSIGNSDYASKRPKYQESRYEITRKLSAEAPAEWTFALLEKRQAQLAKRAVHLWKSDFA